MPRLRSPGRMAVPPGSSLRALRVDRVADRSLTLRSDAPLRNGWSARLAPSVQPGWPPGSSDAWALGCLGALLRYPDRTACRSPLKPEASTRFRRSVRSIYGSLEIAQVPVFLRLTQHRCGL